MKAHIEQNRFFMIVEFRKINPRIHDDIPDENSEALVFILLPIGKQINYLDIRIETIHLSRYT